MLAVIIVFVTSWCTKCVIRRRTGHL